MSNGLADASFFPTAKELSTGLRWFKDHPVLAAAAATAVSVITYLNATETLAHSHSSASNLDDADDDSADDGLGDHYGGGDGAGCNAAGYGSSGSSGSSAANANSYQKRDVGVVVARRRIEGEGAQGDKITMTDTVAATVTTGAGSDEKLSAAVSWCDEHGGSLTQVFEDLLHLAAEDSSGHERLVAAAGGDADRRRVAAARADVARESTMATHSGAAGGAGVRICDSSGRVDASARPFGAAVSAIRKSSTQQSILSAMGGASSDREAFAAQQQQHREESRATSSPGGDPLELQTESPQWGWYVAITPPQDHFHSSLPRAMLQPHRAPSYPGANGARVANAAAAANSTMRRSVSGRIP